MESPEQSPVVSSPPPVAMMRAPNGGQLRRGGSNGGAGGRPPHKIKAKCRKEFDALLPVLKQIAHGKVKTARLDPDSEPVEISTRDRLKAIELFAKFGLDTSVSIADIRTALMATRQELADVLPKEQLDMLWSRIMGHWVKL